MPFDSLVRNGVGLAHTLFNGGGLETTVTWEAFIGQDGYGKPAYDDPIQVLAIVDQNSKQIQRGEHLVTIKATVLVLKGISPNGAVTDPPRDEPFDPRDKITLRDGTTGPILANTGGVEDPTTGRGFLSEILIADL